MIEIIKLFLTGLKKDPVGVRMVQLVDRTLDCLLDSEREICGTDVQPDTVG